MNGMEADQTEAQEVEFDILDEWYEVQEMAGKPFSLGDALVTEGKITTLPNIYDNSINPETSLRGGNIV